MFTVSHKFPCRGRKYVHFYTAIFQMFCFAYILVSTRTICALICQYVICLLFRIYFRIGENNMYTFIQQYSNVDCFAYVPLPWKIIYALLQQYFICLLFDTCPCVRVNNVCTFIRKYCQYLLFGIYPHVWVDNMCTFMQQY